MENLGICRAVHVQTLIPLRLGIPSHWQHPVVDRPRHLEQVDIGDGRLVPVEREGQRGEADFPIRKERIDGGFAREREPGILPLFTCLGLPGN